MDVRLYARGRPAVVVATTQMPGSRKYRPGQRLSVRFLDGREPMRAVMSGGQWNSHTLELTGRDADFWHTVASLVMFDAHDLSTARRVAMQRLEGGHP